MLVHVQWRNGLLKRTKHLVTKLQLECSYQEYWDFIGQYQVTLIATSEQASMIGGFPLAMYIYYAADTVDWENFAVEIISQSRPTAKI